LQHFPVRRFARFCRSVGRRLLAFISMEHAVAVTVLCVAVGGIAAQWLAWRLRLPAIVFLFAVGLLVGPGLRILAPSRALGPALQPIVGLAVAIVVFEGGLALNLHDLRVAGEGVLRLTIIALPLSWIMGVLAAHLVGDMGWGPAILFGAITVVTGPTVVLPLLRQTRLQRRAASFLKWEAIVNDPIGAILAAVVLEILVGRSAAAFAGQIVAAIILAVAFGIAAANLVRWLFLHDQIQEVLKTPLLIALTLGIYAVSNLVMSESGLIAATIFGATLTNMHVPGLTELRRFKESLVILLVAGLFIVLTADLNRSMLAHLSWPIFRLTLLMLFVVRPVAIFIATLRSRLTVQERILSAWIAPRGIVAAAIAGVVGLRLESAGYSTGRLVMPSVFAVIAATMVFHGFTLRPLARRLKLTLSDEPGLAIIGASDWSTDMASALAQVGVPVLLVDIYPGALDLARELKVPVLQAEILSEQGSEELDGRAVDYLVATTPDDIYNGLVCARLAPELGMQHVFQLAPEHGRLDMRRGLSRESRGKVLGEATWNFRVFEERYQEGWRFAIMTVKDDTLPPPKNGDSLRLLTIRKHGQLVFPSIEDDTHPAPVAGDRILVFSPTAEAAASVA
jgi:NhaP-type Na+/H+ or K+/H+ antiporter